MLKIANIVGARPQFIKVKPVIDELNKRKIKHILIHTGQHYDYEMSKVFFDELDIPKPDYNLGIGSRLAGEQIALMAGGIEKILLKERPDIAVVYGDTNSTLAGALAAAKLNIPVAHVEAGLRSYNLNMPEEINRVLTDHISKFLFCPTKTAVKNLSKEGIKNNVYLVGDVMYDIFRKNNNLFGKSRILPRLNLKPKGYLLLTIHRAENTDNIIRLKSILSALKDTKKRVVFPMHPRTEKLLGKAEKAKLKNFLMIKPASYFDMISLEKNAEKIFTDSGGVQKEAYFLGVPCFTLRQETEWAETLIGGRNVLIGADKGKILASAKVDKFLSKKQKAGIFGNARAANKIVRLLSYNS